MQQPNRAVVACAATLVALFATSRAFAHGIVGNHFFPATTATDDPFAVDELALPTFSFVKNSSSEDRLANWEFAGGFEFDKEIFPRFALGVSDTYHYFNPDRGRTAQGWDNLSFSAKYELWRSEPMEAIASVGLDTDVGGTGSRGIGRDSFTTFTPAFFFGKGFGDLPERAGFLRPFAVTGEIGQSFPTSARAPNTLEWGFALEYSLPYLQQQVKDIGLPAPFKNMIPLVEFAFETAENRAEGGLTSGTINPGVIWVSKSVQLGVEANIPVNSRSGTHVGATIQLWIFIDDLFPKIFGHPIFGARS